MIQQVASADKSLNHYDKSLSPTLLRCVHPCGFCCTDYRLNFGGVTHVGAVEGGWSYGKFLHYFDGADSQVNRQQNGQTLWTQRGNSPTPEAHLDLRENVLMNNFLFVSRGSLTAPPLRRQQRQGCSRKISGSATTSRHFGICIY